MSSAVTGMCALSRVALMLVVLASVCLNVEALAQWSAKTKFHNHYNSTSASNQSSASGKSGSLIQQLKLLGKPHGHSAHREKNMSTWEPLPSVSSVVEGSHKVFETLSTQLQNFQSQLDAMESGDAAAIAEERAEYEHQLEMQQSEIAKAAAANNQVSAQIEKLRNINSGLRKNASILAAATHKIRLDVTRMQNNVTVAMDFMQGMMNASDVLLDANEMQIMKELDTEDMLAEKRLAREKSLHSIGMLQISSVTSRRPKENMVPSHLVQTMFASLEGYAHQKTAQENELKTLFERRLRVGSEHMQTLRDEYKQLKTTFQNEKERHGKLITAVQHLEKTYRQLIRQKQYLVKFFHLLADQK